MEVGASELHFAALAFPTFSGTLHPSRSPKQDLLRIRMQQGKLVSSKFPLRRFENSQRHLFEE